MEVENIISASPPNQQKADLSVPGILKHSLQGIPAGTNCYCNMLICHNLTFFVLEAWRSFEGSPSIILAAYHFLLKIFKTMPDKK